MNSTINFIFFVDNHNGLKTPLIECFGERLGTHFYSKLKDGNPTSIVRMMSEMTDDNKELFLEWIDANFDYTKD
jgi:hypothetical protein